ncbi:DIP1984 family protein [Cellulosimicrobium cellulans]|uniref:DIP1984 family protein n=1 Tax=Cellulosimicrobium cellulans TaxID=1710 RepID=UPI0019666C97|nr:DIP1984 family protein [Cellulosimicrobium cellulans]MBN0041597.1 DIP1984 family protein [Cellulosimicrobium cellulans]
MTKLAEALALRADLQRRLAQVASRAVANARHQEGEEPAEDPVALLAEHDRIAAELEQLIARINEVNLTTEVAPGLTMTQALARRDVLRLRHRVRGDLADAGTATQDRFTRTELRFVSAVDVAGLRREADDVARRLRELDTAIQQANWTTEV